MRAADRAAANGQLRADDLARLEAAEALGELGVHLLGRKTGMVSCGDGQLAHLFERHADVDVVFGIAVDVEVALVEELQPPVFVPDRDAMRHAAQHSIQQLATAHLDLVRRRTHLPNLGAHICAGSHRPMVRLMSA